MSPPWTIFQADFLDNGESLVFSTTCTVSADNAERRVYGKLSTISPQKPLLSMCARPPAPPWQLHSEPIAASGSGHTRTQMQLIGRCHPYARKSALNAILSRMQLTLCMRLAQHLTALHAWCKQCVPGR